MVDNFGQFLKHERELRGVPLEEIAGATKIHIRFLQALEENQFDALPGEVFIKGYLRSYAKAIGYDAQDLLRAYDNFIGKNHPEKPAPVLAPRDKKQMPKKWVMGGALAAGAVLVFALFVNFGSGEKEDINGTENSLTTENTSGALELDLEPPVLARKEEILETIDEKVNPKQTEATVAKTSLNEGDSKPDGNQSPEALLKDKKKTQKTQDKNPQERKQNAASSGQDADVKKKRETKPAEVKTAALELQQKPRSIQQAEKKVKAPAKNPASPPPLVSEDVESSVRTTVAVPKPDIEPAQTPIEPQVMEKNSDSEQKEVIIQSIAENSVFGDSSSETPDFVDKSLHLMIQVQGNSWFNLAVDGKPEEDFILPGGTSKSFFGSDKFRVTIGNRRGTQLFLNGQALDIPSSSGDVVRNFEITSQILE